ncbi:MAG: hypothetical protein AB1782_01225 [Cyanobacteriota bacterium]
MKRNNICLIIITLTLVIITDNNLAFSENKTLKVKMPTIISDTETTGVFGSNKPLVIEEKDINQELLDRLKKKYTAKELKEESTAK